MLQIIFLILGGFFIGLSYPTGSELLYFEPIITIIGSLLASVIYLLIGFFKVSRYLKKLTSLQDATVFTSSDILRNYRHWVFLYRFALLIVYSFQIYILNWPLIITYSIGLDNLVFITNFLILAPFLITYLLSVLPFYKMDCYLRKSDWGISEYFIFQIRSYFLITAAPLLVFILYTDIISYWQSLAELIFIYPFIEWFLALGFMLLLYITAPVFLKVFWGLRSFPEGDFKERLMNLTQKAGVRIKDVLIWPIGSGRMANAMAIGLIPSLRYVIFTDTLLNHLTESETETVFGHEIGHLKQHHLHLYLFILIGYAGLSIAFEELLGNIFGRDNSWVIVNLFIFMALYLLVFFGLISRQLEHQADLFGALITNNFLGFINALERIASLNFILPAEKSIQHPSIERRVNFLIAAQQSPAFIKRFINSIKRITYLVTIILVLAGLSWTWGIYKQLGKTSVLKTELNHIKEAERLAKIGVQFIKDRKNEEAIKIFKETTRLQPSNPLYYIYLGDAQAGDKDKLSTGAIASYRKAWSLEPRDTLQRMYLNEKLKTLNTNKVE